MSYDQALADRVKTALGGTRPIQEKRMLGGLTFMVRGKMCVSVGKERIMCRIDPAVHDTAVQRPGCRSVVMKGREYRGFVYVDASTLRTRGALEHWVGLALDYNNRAGDSSAERTQNRASRARNPARNDRWI
jgi:TfoX/Sxy family transcriptional regulator of competence genes